MANLATLPSREPFATAIRGILGMLLLATLAGCSPPGFSDADIEAIKKSIKTEFEKREGVTVIEVTMLKENSKKAIGLVKLNVPLAGEVTKACTATMAEGNKYIWQCP